MGTSPQRKQTPRTGLEDQLSQLFGQALRGGGGGLQDLFSSLSLPEFQGALTAPNTALQGQSLDLAGRGLAAMPGFQALGGDIFSGLANFQGAPMGPDSALSLLTNRPGTGILNSVAGASMGPKSAMDLLASLPGASGLSRLAGGGGTAGRLGAFGGAPIGPESALSLLTNRPGGDVLSLLAGGGGIPGGGGAGPERAALFGMGTEGGGDYAGILSALDQARKGSLSDSMRDISERFSASGLRHSTDLASALGETSNRSEQEFLGLGAQLLPQLAGLKQQALTGAGQLGLGVGQLGLGAGQLRLGAGGQLQQGGLTAADILGQLFQGQQGRSLQGLLGGGQLELGAGQTLQEGGLQSANILQQMFQGQQNRALGAGQTLQAGGLQAGDILGQLFQGQQNRSLSALQSMPGAAELFAMLPGQVAQQGFGLGAAQQGIDTQGLQAIYNEFQRTQGGLFSPLLNFAAGAPQITSPGKGTQWLQALPGAAAAAAGA